MSHFINFSFILAVLNALLLADALPQPQQAGGSISSPQTLCGNNNYDILAGTPWIVDNLVYNADQMVGTQCTYFDKVQTPAGQNEQIVWSSVANIEYVQSTYVSLTDALNPCSTTFCKRYRY